MQQYIKQQKLITRQSHNPFYAKPIFVAEVKSLEELFKDKTL